jgi:hypothetical protein
MSNLDLEKNFYTRKQLEEFAHFQDSQGTRKAQKQLSWHTEEGMKTVSGDYH